MHVNWRIKHDRNEGVWLLGHRFKFETWTNHTTSIENTASKLWLHWFYKSILSFELNSTKFVELVVVLNQYLETNSLRWLDFMYDNYCLPRGNRTTLDSVSWPYQLTNTPCLELFFDVYPRFNITLDSVMNTHITWIRVELSVFLTTFPVRQQCETLNRCRYI